MTSHVHTISKEQFKANFIPHDPGRHRVDVKFNGEKVPNSPWFVEVKDPNTPLLAPMLVANRGVNGAKNGYDTVDNKYGSLNDLSSNSKLNSSYSKVNSEMKQSSMFQQNKVETNNFSSSSKFESNSISSLKKGVDDLSLHRKNHNSSSDFQKSDFGSFSLLETPKLLSGSKSSTSKTYEEERKIQSSSSMDHLNTTSSFTPKTTYSTTIERSINTGSGYSSLNKPHEARVKGLTNGGSSTMPKSSAVNKSVERRSSLHAKVASENGVGQNGHSKTQEMVSSSYNATSSSSQQSSSFQSSTISSSLKAVHQESSKESALTSSKQSQNTVPGSPKLSSYKGTAEKCKFVGETVRHFNAGKPATFELFAPGARKGDVAVNIISKFGRF